MKRKIVTALIVFIIAGCFQFYRSFSAVSEKRIVMKKLNAKLAFKLASIRSLLLQSPMCSKALVPKKIKRLSDGCQIDFYGDYHAILLWLQRLSHSCRIGMLVSLQLLRGSPLFLQIIGKQNLCTK
jgi:hypothetical protein